MPGIWAAVNATSTTVGSSRYTTLKLWKSRPAAPRMTIRSRGRPTADSAARFVMNGGPIGAAKTFP
jgi:hypothetical protein